MQRTLILLLSFMYLQADDPVKDFGLSISTNKFTSVVYCEGQLFINDVKVKCICGKPFIYANILDEAVDPYCEDCLFLLPRSNKNSAHRSME